MAAQGVTGVNNSITLTAIDVQRQPCTEQDITFSTVIQPVYANGTKARSISASAAVVPGQIAGTYDIIWSADSLAADGGLLVYRIDVGAVVGTKVQVKHQPGISFCVD